MPLPSIPHRQRFAESPLAGNPLAVFEDGRGLDDATMQALALQFNLSETTFVLPSTTATARVRIFTPTFEMPFAGHPTLGTAHVVRDLLRAGDDVTLEMRAGTIPVHADGDVWTLTANAPRHRSPSASRDAARAHAGACRSATSPPNVQPLWVDTGSEQLVIPLASFDAVRRAQPRGGGATACTAATASAQWLMSSRANAIAVLARFFFPKHGAVIEDPGTGSACANLGGWLLAMNAAAAASNSSSTRARPSDGAAGSACASTPIGRSACRAA